jgi:hypothetical protein
MQASRKSHANITQKLLKSLGNVTQKPGKLHEKEAQTSRKRNATRRNLQANDTRHANITKRSRIGHANVTVLTRVCCFIPSRPFHTFESFSCKIRLNIRLS